ncbi:hypothetical protein CEXT_474151, partial [Caerostris extrusa]
MDIFCQQECPVVTTLRHRATDPEVGAGRCTGTNNQDS